MVVDGSTDGSAKVAAQFLSVRFISQRNQGVSAARNTGFAASRGEFVIFHDADDRLDPRALEIGLAAHEERLTAGLCTASRRRSTRRAASKRGRSTAG